MKFKLLSLSCFMLLASFVSAQFSPVNWSYDAEKIGDKEYKVVFTADIENGWYVYSQFLEEGGPIPTAFTFTEKEGIEFVGKIEEEGENKKENFDDLFGMKLTKYGDKVRFTQKIKVSTAAKMIKGYLTFMTCNNESCLPPKDVDFEIDLNVGQ